MKAIYEWCSGTHCGLDETTDPAFYARMQMVHETAKISLSKKKAEEHDDWLRFSSVVHSHPQQMPPTGWQDWPIGV